MRSILSPKLRFRLKVWPTLSLKLNFRLKVDHILSLNLSFRLSEELIQSTCEHDFSIAHSMNDKWILKNVELNYSRHPQTVTLKCLCVDVDTVIFTLHAGVSRTKSSDCGIFICKVLCNTSN